MFVMLPGFDRSRQWVVLAALFACHVYFLQIYPHFVSPNELSRLLLTSAIVDDTSLAIDHAIRRYGDTQDKASFQGHYYSDKAIGTSLLAVPAFLLMRCVESAAGQMFSTQAVLFWLRLWTVTIPSLLFLRILTTLWMRLKPRSRYIPHSLFLHVFGTIAFTYSNQFVSHYLLGIALFCSAVFLNECRLNPDVRRREILLSGGFAGLSLLLEWPAAVPVAVLFAFAVVLLRKASRLSYFAAPVFICVGVILGYNYLIFGSPWDVAYRHMTDSFHVAKHAEGLVGMGVPRLEALHGLLFSRHHGLFFISPFLLLSIPGLLRMSRRQEWSFLAKLSAGVALATILTYSAFSFWIGGWNFGPRYLTAVVPFLSTATFYCADEFLQKRFLNRALFGGTGIWSVLCTTTATITFPFAPDVLKDPIFFLNMPLWINGATGENCAANPWMFVPLLAGTWIVMTFRSGERAWIGRKVVNALGPLGVAGLIFVAGLLGRPDPTAMDYYARGSVYLYLGRYEQAYSEMQFALAANPDPNTRALIQKGISDLADRMKQ